MNSLKAEPCLESGVHDLFVLQLYAKVVDLGEGPPYFELKKKKSQKEKSRDRISKTNPPHLLAQGLDSSQTVPLHVHKTFYYIASSLSTQDEPNRVL